MSSGKVKCTCGWSWNKSDSSKKDMYICHECGRDNSNNMKNGGWLDSYADGGTMQEHQENYNNSQASAPEGMVGDGFSNVGRNYSPAWGGQFQNGGKAPLYVESKNDPRYKAYQDSLALYDFQEKVGGKSSKWLKSVPKNKKGMVSEKDWENYSKRTEKFTSKKELDKQWDAFNRLTKLNKKEPGKKYPFKQELKILPNGFDTYVSDFEKPQQQVIVKKQEERKPIQAIQNNIQPEGIENDFSIDAQLPVIRPEARMPKSYDVNSQRQTMSGPSEYYNYSDEGVDISDALRAKESADAYNQYVQEKYKEAAKSNPKAQKRLEQLMQNVELTPNYQMGGSVYPVNYVPQAQTGMSMPGSVGFTYARTKGIPSNGPYAKKTMASAQNGQEMQYYREGLDFQPKTISKNGGWLDGYEKAQGGYTTGDKVEYGTPEYTEAYNKGEVVTDEGMRSPIALDEVVIQNNYRRPRGVWEQYADKIVEENKDAGLLGAIIGTPISAITSVPQLMGMKALTGEMQRPSEAMDIENPYGAMAVDAVTDPTNLIGTGILTKEKALARLSNLKNINAEGKIFSGMNNELNNMAIQNTERYMAKRTPTTSTLSPEMEPYVSRYTKLSDEPYIPYQEDEYIKWFNEQKAKMNPPVVKQDPRSILRSSSVIDINDMRQGGIIKDDRGQWAYPGEITEINSNDITMQGVPYDVLGISDTGDTKLMKPGKNYKFKGKKVTEFPMAKNGLRQEQKGLQNLDNLLNFTNYNTKQPGGWLDTL